MDKSAPTYTTPGTYIDIENRIIDKYLPHIGVYGFTVYVAIKRHLDQTPTPCPPSYATIARKFGIDQGSVIRHVKKLQRLHLLSPSLRFKEEGES
jgi:DNA-binding MarR family transcriptional regulator